MQKARRHHPLRMAPTDCKRTVSGTISLPCSGCFSPFPHGTGSLSVSQEYLALPDGPGRFRQDFSCPAYSGYQYNYNTYMYGTFTFYGLTFQTYSISIQYNMTGPTTPTTPKHYRFGLFPVRSPLLRESLLFSFPPGTKMFQFSGFASRLRDTTPSS